MDAMEYERVDRTTRSAIYDMTDEQKEQFLYSLFPHIQTPHFKVAIIGSHDMKKAVKDVLRSEPKDQNDPLLSVVRCSGAWKNLDKSMTEFGKQKITEALSVLKP